jgi:hypothetical protein
MRKFKPLPRKERLHELFTYSFIEGTLYRKTYAGLKPTGATARVRGYASARVDGVSYQRNRLTWAYFYDDPGANTVDHINHMRDDDRIENLRLATEEQNRRNSKMYCTNTTGFKGVYYDARSNKWQALMCMKYRKFSLGYYSTKEEAAAAYAEAASRLHGEFAGHLQ